MPLSEQVPSPPVLASGQHGKPHLGAAASGAEGGIISVLQMRNGPTAGKVGAAHAV